MALISPYQIDAATTYEATVFLPVEENFYIILHTWDFEFKIYFVLCSPSSFCTAWYIEPAINISWFILSEQNKNETQAQSNGQRLKL